MARKGDPILHFEVSYADDPESNETGIFTSSQQVRNKFGNSLADFVDVHYWKFPDDMFSLDVTIELQNVKLKSEQYN